MSREQWVGQASVVFMVLLMVGCGGDDGADGLDANPLSVTSGPASAEDCPAGGTELRFGYDTTGDDQIDEVVNVELICEGSSGEDGRDGEDGEDGLAVLLETEETAVGECITGGMVYRFGYDTTGDGAIDEISSEYTTCDEQSSQALIAGRRVLYFVDGVVGSDVLLPALEDLEDDGLIELIVAESREDFRDEVVDSSPDVTLYFAQNSPLVSQDRDILIDLVNNEGRLIFATYRSVDNEDLFAAL